MEACTRRRHRVGSASRTTGRAAGGRRRKRPEEGEAEKAAVAVHGACGFWGVFATGLFSASDYAYGSGAGLFYGSGNALGVAIVFLLATIAWVCSLSFLMFFALKKMGLLRVSAEVEAAGMDVSKHGGNAYSAE